MPSFSTRRGTYKYYYQPYINPVEIQKPVFFYSLIIIVFVIAVITSSQFIPHYIQIQYPVWFVESGFYWIHDILIITIAHCLPPIFIVIMLINCHVPHDILHKIIQKHASHKLVFHLSTFLTILVILSSITIYFKYNWSNIYLIKSDSVVCTYFEHSALNLWDTWFYLIHRAILPLILYVMYLIYYCKISNQSVRNNKSIDIHNEFEMSLIQNDSHNKHVHENNHSQTTTSYTITSCVIYLSLYGITIFVIHCQFAVSVELLNNRFELIYIIFNIWLKLLKFISKRAARLCDQLRSQKSMHDHYICLEYLTEWIFDVIYSNFVRYYIVFKVPSLLQYFFALSVHFSMEMLQTNMRYTSIFLKVSNYLSLLTVTDPKVWRTRLSMDFMLRFYASLLCTLMTIIQFVAYGKDWFEDQFGSDNYNRVVIYTLVSGITELLHYTLTVAIVQKLYKFNIITPFVSYVSMTNNKHRIVLLLLYGTLFVMLLGWTRIYES